jgi:hypothetical protein
LVCIYIYIYCIVMIFHPHSAAIWLNYGFMKCNKLCMCVRTCVHTYVCMHVCCVYACLHVCLYVYICVCACMHAHVGRPKSNATLFSYKWQLFQCDSRVTCNVVCRETKFVYKWSTNPLVHPKDSPNLIYIWVFWVSNSFRINEHFTNYNPWSE